MKLWVSEEGGIFFEKLIDNQLFNNILPHGLSK
jgi:hypothetical protein